MNKNDTPDPVTTCVVCKEEMSTYGYDLPTELPTCSTECWWWLTNHPQLYGEAND